MQIYLIRHGCTAGNLEHRYVGTTDEELTEDAVRELCAARARYPVPDVVFTSPLKRCTQTAGILFPEQRPETLADLRECEFGDFEYKNYQELKENAAYRAWIGGGAEGACPGGERREDFAKRCCRAFEEGCRSAMARGCRTAAFVVHGGTIMAILDRFSRPHRGYFDWQVKNSGGFEGKLVWLQSGEDAGSQAEAFAVSGIEDIVSLPQDTGPIGIEGRTIRKQNKMLRCGYTTGSCAAAAAKAAADMLLGGHICSYADLTTPGGVALRLPVQGQHIGTGYAQCAVRKYGGDDPDATDGLLIWARAEYAQEPSCRDSGGERSGEPGQERGECRILIDGGVGIGRVTKPGLDQPVGAAAINRVPREMIAREAAAVCTAYGYGGWLRITISAPGGVEAARRTFNPRIGIEGGISILGTSGIVVPMSEEALIASIRLEMQQKYAQGERWLLVTPGNYGADFLGRERRRLKLDAERSMKCSNYVGETVDLAVELGFHGILFVAHIGKFIKVSGGIMNTHSAQADCRAELLAAHTLRALQNGPERAQKAAGEAPGEAVHDPAEQQRLALRLLGTETTEEAVRILQDAGVLGLVMHEVTGRIRACLQRRCQGAIRTEAILFSSRLGYLGETEGAEQLIGELLRQQERVEGYGKEEKRNI